MRGYGLSMRMVRMLMFTVLFLKTCKAHFSLREEALMLVALAPAILEGVLGVSENLDETPQHEFKESQNVQVHR
jgi:hypothetical protein